MIQLFYLLAACFIAIFPSSATSNEASCTAEEIAILEEVHDLVKPYLLPKNSPAHLTLDRIFSTNRVLANMKSLKKAGFNATPPRKFTKLLVATHTEFPGCFFKIYLDNQRYYQRTPEYKQWIQRIRGAELIRKEIKRKGWDHLFKVPKKWIYLLPALPVAARHTIPKYTILIEEDMVLMDRSANSARWRSDQISYELLSALFYLVQHLGLSDCLKLDNIPFSFDGKVSFVDTQTYNGSVNFELLYESLSPENKKVWQELSNLQKQGDH